VNPLALAPTLLSLLETPVPATMTASPLDAWRTPRSRLPDQGES
jgi:hypothetical protein